MNEFRVRKLTGVRWWVVEEFRIFTHPRTRQQYGLWMAHAVEHTFADAIAHADKCARTRAAAELGVRR